MNTNSFWNRFKSETQKSGTLLAASPTPPKKKNTEIYLGELAEVLYYVVQIILQLLNY